ncbi:hypothetical protein P3T23_001324 [Paraburkholderia sp. GAS448]|uniref:hypothetical protein n=1 Tax=Paraburkholderia sp. GAS448 TaxID=3035136 RepID=UPI003D220EDB
MLPVRSIRFTRGGIAAVLLTTAFLLPVANAASGGQPLILDTQRGISDGQSGTILQTAPLSHARIVQAQPIASPTELSTDSSVPIMVAPYINLPVGAGGSQRAQPSPRPLPRPTLPSVPPSAP